MLRLEHVTSLMLMRLTAHPAQYASTVSYSGARDAYDGALNTSLATLVTSVLSKLDTALGSMSKTRWGELESVGDQSKYVDGVQSLLQELAPP